MTKALRLSTLAVCGVLSSAAYAGTVSSQLWKLPDVDTYTANPGSLPATTPDVTFNSPTPFNYSLDGTVSDWLATGGASSIVENTPGTLASRMSDSVIGTIVDIKGCVTVNTGDQFTFTHDDGMYLAINGIDLGFLASPTSPFTETQTYSGASGTFPFELIYTENHSGPAVLVGGTDAFVTCPDSGSSLALMSGAVGVLGFVTRRVRSVASR